MNHPLAFAQRCAQRLAEWIGSSSQNVTVAGSIRRQRPICNDVDLVVIPQLEEEKDIFGAVVGQRNVTRSRLQERARSEAWVIHRDGGDIFSATHKGIQIDVFWAAAANYGTRLLCRTGSKEHNIWLAQWAEARGCRWHPMDGLYERNHKVSRTEDEIYAYLGLPFIAPEHREAAILLPRYPVHRAPAFDRRSS